MHPTPDTHSGDLPWSKSIKPTSSLFSLLYNAAEPRQQICQGLYHIFFKVEALAGKGSEVNI